MNRLGLLVLAAALLLLPSHGFGQFGLGRSIPLATADSFDGRFVFCRGYYRRNPYGDGGGWSTDYPRADENYSTRLGELTKTLVSRRSDGSINHLIVTLTQPELFRCPWVMMAEVGSLYLDEVESANLRAYLRKGGLLWVDDFWGSHAWNVWEEQIRKVLPSGEYPIIDLPPTHAVFHMLYDISEMPQIPSINFWFGSGQTSERGSDSREPHARAIFDERGRIMVLMTHNTDFGDSFEREGDNREYFVQFAPVGYAFGVNAWLYAMTH
jgi:hypothetical protein